MRTWPPPRFSSSRAVSSGTAQSLRQSLDRRSGVRRPCRPRPRLLTPMLVAAHGPAGTADTHSTLRRISFRIPTSSGSDRPLDSNRGATSVPGPARRTARGASSRPRPTPTTSTARRSFSSTVKARSASTTGSRSGAPVSTSISSLHLLRQIAEAVDFSHAEALGPARPGARFEA